MSAHPQPVRAADPDLMDLSAPLKPLKLELERGCNDDAVLEGFAAYLMRWTQEAAGAAEPELRQRLLRIADAFGEYADLPTAARRELCEKTIKALALYARRFGPPTAITAGSDVRYLRGVGPKRAELLAQLGIRTVGDLLRHYPTRYDDRRNTPPAASLEHRQMATVRVTVTGPGRVRRPRGRTLAEVPATDGETPLTLVWFNQPYRAQQFDEGAVLLATGQAMIRKGEISLTVGEVEAIEDESEGESVNIGRIVPLYSLTPGLTHTMMRKLISAALEVCDPLPEGAVPAEVVDARGLSPLPEATLEIHFPEAEASRKEARARIAYEELFVLQAVLARRRGTMKRQDGAGSISARAVIAELAAALPFALTPAQARVMDDIAGDLEDPAPANRLIHGDVGSGKTVCAALALLAAARAGRQGALMAPTTLLAEQHHQTLTDLLGPLGIPCRLLTGSLGAAARKHAHARAERGDDAVLIGTQALFQQSVVFRDLAVAVIDEQHRFGVRQRAELSGKGTRPNVFVMSATPIPRTLALTAYGDFDVSVLDELPPGRKPVTTALAWGSDRRRAYETLAARVVAGGQAYIVCPLIDGGEEARLAGAEREFNRLRAGQLACFELGLLHGKIDADQRDEVMERFRRGDIEILVATTVIEVGVDVPNATVMLVENAERFGLAQLHQLRGRVGRGEEESICVLLTRAKSPDVIERLQVLERTNDGFEIAEEDLRRRGPGELTGVRQSGLPDLRMADLVADTQTLVKAREDAFGIIQDDPGLAAPEHAALREVLAEFEGRQGEWAM